MATTKDKPVPVLLCFEKGCKSPRLPGTTRCAEHPLTIRAEIAAGPTFQMVGVDAPCVACLRTLFVDYYTDLCMDCWRAWRWSPIRERGVGVQPIVSRAVREELDRTSVPPGACGRVVYDRSGKPIGKCLGGIGGSQHCCEEKS